MPDSYHFSHRFFLECVCRRNKPPTVCATVSGSLCRTLTLPSLLAIDWWKASNSCYQGNHVRLWIDFCWALWDSLGCWLSLPGTARLPWTVSLQKAVWSNTEEPPLYFHVSCLITPLISDCNILKCSLCNGASPLEILPLYTKMRKMCPPSILNGALILICNMRVKQALIILIDSSLTRWWEMLYNRQNVCHPDLHMEVWYNTIDIP